MARKRISNEEKAMRAMREMAEKAAKYGLTINPEEALKKIGTDKNHEADAVLKWLHEPHAMMQKRCRRCGEIFATNYCSVGYCGNGCRTRDLKDLFGIDWQPQSNTWGRYEPPVVLPYGTLVQIRAWAEKFLADFDSLEQKSLEHVDQDFFA